MTPEERRKTFALKFVLWAMEEIGWNPKSADWSDADRKAELLAACQRYADPIMNHTEAELCRVIDLVEDYLK